MTTKKKAIYVVIDINHQHSTLAVMTPEKQLAFSTGKTAATMETGIRQLRQSYKQLNSKNTYQIVKLICAVPRPNTENGSFSDYRMLPWSNQPLLVHLAHAFKCPVQLVNRYELEALGEATFGAGKNERMMMYYHVGNNVSGTCVVEQKLERSLFRYRPEHQLIAQTHGNYQTLEELISLRNMEEQLNRRKENVTKCALVSEIEHHLAVGLFNSMTHWGQPGIIVIGGRLAADLSPKKISEALEALSNNKAPKIKRSEKSGTGYGTLYGALALIRAEIKNPAPPTDEAE